MPGTLEAVHVGVRQSVNEVVEVAVVKDRVARTPEQERRHVEAAHTLGDPIELGGTLMRGIRRDIGDERPDSAPTVSAPVGSPIAALDVRRERRMRQGQRRLQERRCADGGHPEHPPAQGEPQRGRDRGALRLVKSSVQQHDAGKQLWVVDGPAHRYDAAPVVPEGDDGADEPDGGGEIGEIAHPLLERAQPAGALGKAHLQLVDRDHAPGVADRSRGIRRRRSCH